MDDGETLAARVSELEVRLTLQQDELDKLSEELFRQQRALDALVGRLKSLEGRRAAAAEEGEAAAPDEVPPHY